MEREQSVLIVDPCKETREVLATALARRGVRTYSASHSRQGFQLAQRVHPDLVVLDAEVDRRGRRAVCADFVERARLTHTPLLLLGGAHRHDEASCRGEFVPKPYHYGPLIRRIEELLGTAERTVA